MRFICDAMLGRLAKWLRILSFDTVYAQANDHELARQARAEDRVLLTRDQQLAQRRGIRALLIDADELDDQLAQVVAAFGLEPTLDRARCPLCNVRLREVRRASVRDRVPPYVWEHHSSFRECPACRRVYWRGSHWRRMQRRAANLGDAGASG
jgi:uncharacterized protein with PIN domain